jgi:uncharacterized membrane protein
MQAETTAKHRRPRHQVFLHAVRARPRLLSSTLVGFAVYFGAPHNWSVETRGIFSWDVAVFLYLALVLRLAQRASPDRIRLRARLQDDGAVVTLLFSTIAAIACFVAIAFELSNVKGMVGADKLYHAILVGVTIPSAWAFIHAMFALHYAHEFYDAADSRGHGLVFPGDHPKTYWDFLYFSYIIGTSGQTADVSISCPSLRKVALIHCVLAFFFNITMLGLTINVASSLL